MSDDADQVLSGGNLFHDLSDDDFKSEGSPAEHRSTSAAAVERKKESFLDEGKSSGSAKTDHLPLQDPAMGVVGSRGLNLLAAFVDDGMPSSDDEAAAGTPVVASNGTTVDGDGDEWQKESDEETAALSNPASAATSASSPGRSIDDEVKVEQKLDRFLSTLKFQYNGLHSIRNMSVSVLKLLMFISVIARGILNLSVAVYNMVILYDAKAAFGFGGASSEEQELNVRSTFKWLVFGLELTTLSVLFACKNYCLFNYVFRRHSANVTRRKLGLYLYFTGHLLNYVASFSALKFAPSTSHIIGFFTVNLKRSYTINSVKVGSTAAMVWCTVQGIAYVVLRAFGVIVFLTKLQQLDFVATSSVWSWADRDWLLVLAFMNNVMSVANIKQLQMDVLMQLIFSGGDAEMSAKEFWYQQTTLSLISIRLIETHGMSRGAILLINLSHADIQRLLLSEEGRSATYKTSASTDTSVNSRSSRDQYAELGITLGTELTKMSPRDASAALKEYRRYQHRFTPARTEHASTTSAFYQNRATRQVGSNSASRYSYRLGETAQRSRVGDQHDMREDLDRELTPYSYR